MNGSMTGRTMGGRYVIEDRVGLGGMAEVYRATDTVLGRTVAVKVMLPQYAEDETFTKRFRQEAASAAQLQSPYIVNIYDWGQDQGQYFIVMEYVRGADLKTGIAQRGAINQRKVAEIGSQVCQALSVAHSQDIVHRDIKPQNIMVQPDGNIKVMDFGIARAKNAGLTQTSSVLGTAHYISPEQAQGKELGSASDIYSLGVVLYEASTGRLPFDGPDAVSVAMKQVSEQPIPPRAINNEIDPTLEAIILKAMAKNPADRFITALEMRRCLNDFLAGRTVSNVGANAFAKTAVIGGVAAAGAVGAATQMMPSVEPVPATPAKPVSPTVNTYRTSNDSGKAPSSKGKIIGIVAAIVAAIALIGFLSTFLLGSGNIAVPDVTNCTQAEATQKLQDANLKLGDITTASSATVPEGKVISQDPAAGRRVKEGDKVNLVISSGSEQVVVPDLTGMTADEAKKTLSSLGLKATAGKAAYSKDIDKEKIMSQSPEANSKVAKGTTIEYCLSLGVEAISVPNVVGKTENEALTTLQEAGFKVSVQTGESDKYANGTVYQQDPASGTKLETSKTITIYVSTGGAKIEIPYVIGDTLGSAKSKLTAQGFSYIVAGSNDDSATVVNQSDFGQGSKGQTIYLTTQSSSGENTNTNTNSSSSGN